MHDDTAKPIFADRATIESGSVKRLSDRFGDYTIRIECRRCGHAREVDPHAIARIFGWEAEIERIRPHFRCSKCHAKDAVVRIGSHRRPRRWNKNPS